MPSRTVRRIRTDPDVTHAVVSATQFAREMEFNELQSRSIGTVVSELATNILKYAEFGRVTIEEVQSGSRRGMQITVADRGPGIENVEEALRDHFSSSGTLGLGLPGVRRMVDDFSIESKTGEGTTVVVQKWLESVSPPRRVSLPAAVTGSEAFSERGTDRGSLLFPAGDAESRPLEVAYVNRPCRGELVSGDGVAVTEVEDGVLIVVVDGLGHGREANGAAKAATRYVRREPTSDLGHLMKKLNERLRETVGAAVSLCWIELSSGTTRYAAVGNTVLRLEGERALRLTATAGTVGSQVKNVRVDSARLTEGDVLIIHTDGISDRTTFDDYPQLRYQSAETVAEKIVGRYGKRHDDATVVVCRFKTR